MAKKKKQGVVSPTRLASFDKEKKLHVIIETPKGSRNKYVWDPDQQIFRIEEGFAGGDGISARFLASSLQRKLKTGIRLTF